MQQQRSCFYANVENSKGEREGPLSRAGTRATRLPGRVALTGVEGLRGTSDVFRAKSTQSVSSSLKDSHPPLGLGSGPGQAECLQPVRVWGIHCRISPLL